MGTAEARRWFLGVAMALSALPPAGAESLVVFGNEGYPPTLSTVGGVPAGALADVLAAASRQTGDTYLVSLTPWRRAYEQGLRGDGLVVGIAQAPGRAALFDFSEPIMEDEVHAVTLASRHLSIRGAADMDGLAVGAISGATFGPDIDGAAAAGRFVIDGDFSQVGRLRKVLAGRLDVALVGNGVSGIEALIASHPELASERSRLSISPEPVYRNPLRLAAAKSMGKAQAIARFDAALAKMRASGELSAILGKPSAAAAALGAFRPAPVPAKAPAPPRGR